MGVDDKSEKKNTPDSVVCSNLLYGCQTRSRKNKGEKEKDSL